MPDFSEQLFARHGINVSRETLGTFERYAQLLRKWQNAINLVSDDTIEEMATRHFLDSAQLIKFLPNKNIVLVDMGSGAGFPGLVLAMLGVTNVHLIESDVRKATFLREVSRETKTNVFVHDDRVEVTNIKNIDVITARALAPLKDLLVMADKLMTPKYPTACLFLKGEKTEEELSKAQKKWNFTLETIKSITNDSGKVLKINNLTKK